MRDKLLSGAPACGEVAAVSVHLNVKGGPAMTHRTEGDLAQEECHPCGRIPFGPFSLLAGCHAFRKNPLGSEHLAASRRSGPG